MFDEPNENFGEDPTERAFDPKVKAQEKAAEFRMHAELFAVFEGGRKFDAQLLPGLNADVARGIQKTVARLEKSKITGTPVLPDAVTTDAATLLDMPATSALTTNDYHIHRRPGEVMIVRWLAGEQVDSFYERLQAHFNAAMDGFREEERTENQWKQDPKVLAYLDALDGVDLKMKDWYLRDIIRQHGAFVLSTQSADDINIAYLSDYVMSVSPADIVGTASAPPETPTEKDLAWFYKMFNLRGIKDGVEQMCFFTFLQKSDDDFEF